MLNPEDDIEKIYRDFAKNYPLKTDDNGWDEFLQKMESAPVKGLPAKKPGGASPFAGVLKKYGYWLTAAALVVIITGILFIQNKNNNNGVSTAQPTINDNTAKAPTVKPLATTVATNKGLQPVGKPSQTQPADVSDQPIVSKASQLKAEGVDKNAISPNKRNTQLIQEENSAAAKNNKKQPTLSKIDQPITTGLTQQNNQVENGTKQGVRKDSGETANVNDGLPAGGNAFAQNSNNTNSVTTVNGNIIARDKSQNLSGQSANADSVKNADNKTPPLVSNGTEITNIKAPKLLKTDTAESLASPNNILNKNNTLAIAAAVQKQPSNAGKTQPMVKVKTDGGKYFYLGLAAGPDFSTVKFQKVKSTGFTTGITFGVHVSDNTSIESGLLYTEKKYYSSAAYFKGPNLPPPPNLAALQSISANGKFLEIPITVKYNFINKKHYDLFINGGLSSYFTKRERYDLLYRRPFGNEMQRDNDDRPIANILSVVHLSAGYEFKFNTGNAVRFEPYVKIPLSGLGSGSLPITSSGFYISFTHSFFK